MPTTATAFCVVAMDGDEDAESGLDHDGEEERDGGGVEERARQWRESGVGVAVVEEGRNGRRMVLERDEMKWPAGEGWRPL